MNLTAFFSIILTLPLIYGSTSDLCKTGTVEDVLAMLKASVDGPEALRQKAQQCFDEAIGAKNYKILGALSSEHLLDPASLIDAVKDEACSLIDALQMTQLLLKCDWVAKPGKETVSGFELFRSLLIRGEFNFRILLGIFENAAKAGDLGLIKTLVEMIQDGATASSIAIHASAYAGSPNEASYVINTCLSRAFRDASASGHFDLIKYLLSKFNPRMDDLVELFISACEFGRIDVAESVCSKYGVDPKTFARGAVYRVVRSGSVKGLQFLLDKGVNPSVIDHFILQDAFCGESKAMLEYLLSLPNINPAVGLTDLLKWTKYLHNIENLDVLLADPRVLAALDGPMVDMVLGNPSSDQAKLVLLNWLAWNIPYLSWIPTYKTVALLDPESASFHQPFIDKTIGMLEANGLHKIAAFIKEWTGAVLGYATTIAAVHGDSTFVDIFDSYLAVSLSEKF